MREYDNSKIHISSNFLLSICLIIMLDTLLLVPPLHCNISLHFTTLIDPSLPLIYTSLPSHLASHTYISYRSIFRHITKLDTVRLSHPQTYFQNNEPLHCPKESLTISLHFFFFFFFHLSYPPFTSLYFVIHLYNSLPFTSLPFTSLHFTSPPFTFYFLSPLLPPLFYTFLTLVLKI